MIKKIWHIAAIAILLANCTKEYEPQDLSNKDQMNRLVISDPLVWNSLITQSIEIDTAGGGFKAGNGMNGLTEYPRKGYYFAVFEDLFPSQGDYDFNDVILQSKLYLDGKGGEVWGHINTSVLNRGGSLKTKIALIFYSVAGNKLYTRIENSQLLINGQSLQGAEPFFLDIPTAGKNFDVEFYVRKTTNNINQIWITWFIIVESGGKYQEIHSSGFPVSTKTSFEFPQRDFLTSKNIPWGLEIEAEKFYVPREKALFLNAFPEFRDWAESGGVKSKSWFTNPDVKYIK